MYFQEGTTPLVLAAANNHLECVKELLKQGADPSARRLVSKPIDEPSTYMYTIILYSKETCKPSVCINNML